MNTPPTNPAPDVDPLTVPIPCPENASWILKLIWFNKEGDRRRAVRKRAQKEQEASCGKEEFQETLSQIQENQTDLPSSPDEDE